MSYFCECLLSSSRSNSVYGIPAPAPKDYAALLHLLEEHSESEQLVILERVQKCHHPSLAEENKDKLKVTD